MSSEKDYHQLMTSYQLLEKENRKLKKMLSLENISALEILVGIKYNRDQLRKVAMDF